MASEFAACPGSHRTTQMAPPPKKAALSLKAAPPTVKELAAMPRIPAPVVPAKAPSMQYTTELDSVLLAPPAKTPPPGLVPHPLLSPGGMAVPVKAPPPFLLPVKQPPPPVPVKAPPISLLMKVASLKWIPTQPKARSSREALVPMKTLRASSLNGSDLLMRIGGSGEIIGLRELRVNAALAYNSHDLLFQLHDWGCNRKKASLLDLAVAFGYGEIAVELVLRGVLLQSLALEDLRTDAAIQAAILIAEIDDVVADYIRNLRLQNIDWKSPVMRTRSISLLDKAVEAGQPEFAKKLSCFGVPLLDPDAVLSCMQTLLSTRRCLHPFADALPDEGITTHLWRLIAVLEVDVGAEQAALRWQGLHFSAMDVVLAFHKPLDKLLREPGRSKRFIGVRDFADMLSSRGAASALGAMLGTCLLDDDLLLDLNAVQTACAIGIDVRSLLVRGSRPCNLLSFAITNGQRTVAEYLVSCGCEYPTLTIAELDTNEGFGTSAFAKVAAALQILRSSRQRYNAVLLQLIKQKGIPFPYGIEHTIINLALPIPPFAESFQFTALDRIALGKIADFAENEDHDWRSPLPSLAGSITSISEYHLSPRQPGRYFEDEETRCVAVVNFSPGDPGELELNVGDKIVVTYDPEPFAGSQRWAHGYNERLDLRGWFPVSHTSKEQLWG